MGLLLVSATLFGLMAFTAKLASQNISGAQVAMIRFLISLAPIAISPSFRRAAFTFHRIDILFYRGFFGGLAVLLYFLAIAHIPVGVATLLNYTSPVFAGMFAALFIGERVRGIVIAPFVLALTGVVLVVHSHATPDEVLGFGRWELAGLCSAVLSGAAVTAIRFARRTEGSWSIFASLSLFGLLATAPFAIPAWKNPTPREWMILLAMGILSIGAQLLMTHAYRWVETLVAGVISQFGVVVSMILGALFLAERITLATALGTGLTIGGVVLVIALAAPKESVDLPI